MPAFFVLAPCDRSASAFAYFVMCPDKEDKSRPALTAADIAPAALVIAAYAVIGSINVFIRFD